MRKTRGRPIRVKWSALKSMVPILQPTAVHHPTKLKAMAAPGASAQAVRTARQARATTRRRASNIEGFAAAALVLTFGLLNLKPLVQTLARIVQLRSFEIRQAFRVDQDT